MPTYKMTKTQGKKRLAEMQAKASKLFLAGYISLKDYEAVARIVKLRIGQLK